MGQHPNQPPNPRLLQSLRLNQQHQIRQLRYQQMLLQLRQKRESNKHQLSNLKRRKERDKAAILMVKRKEEKVKRRRMSRLWVEVVLEWMVRAIKTLKNVQKIRMSLHALRQENVFG